VLDFSKSQEVNVTILDPDHGDCLFSRQMAPSEIMNAVGLPPHNFCKSQEVNVAILDPDHGDCLFSRQMATS
jgi:hypothetical protein